MWNSVLMDGVKWSFDRSSPPLTDGTHPDFGLEETQYRSWNFESHQQTNYSDWTNRLHPGEEEDAEDLFVPHDPADCSRRNYTSAAELFRNFVGKLSSKRFSPFCAYFILKRIAVVFPHGHLNCLSSTDYFFLFYFLFF